MEGFGEGGGRLKPPTKGSAIGPISSTGWNLPSGPLKGALHRASSFMRGMWRVAWVYLGAGAYLGTRDRQDLPFVLDGAHATPEYP